jgi:hypothetical protein
MSVRRAIPLIAALVVLGAPSAAGAAPDLAVSVSCPAQVRVTDEPKCAMAIHNAGDAPADNVVASLDSPGQILENQVEGSEFNCDRGGAKATCAITQIGAGQTATLRTQSGIPLPVSARIGSSSEVFRLNGEASVADDPTPADNSDTASMKVTYPRVIAPIGGSPHTARAAANYGNHFCGVETGTGTTWTRAWCVFNIHSSQVQGKWGVGSIRANPVGATQFLYPTDRSRQIEIDVRLQVRGDTGFGRSSWESVQNQLYTDGQWWRVENRLGASPFKLWRWRYLGLKGSARAPDRFSFLHGNQLYRLQVRFQFADRRLGGLYVVQGNSGWYSVRFQVSGDESATSVG